ncbi:hypothetical protein PTTG_29884 [Puccinia triticina 1-1 BBBD Race 1]|uniref:Uncharacterized protein n=1 Tax=Puccinia triticina (isolate 1-1 / race 1 (BBBD)) TaxID=630390 RepID=A0A180G1I3_PUCT1|nr:hypothetical protein PTTG_29884 [Puccinia triticina 1-1 BBBD Race 1]
MDERSSATAALNQIITRNTHRKARHSINTTTAQQQQQLASSRHHSLTAPLNAGFLARYPSAAGPGPVPGPSTASDDDDPSPACPPPRPLPRPAPAPPPSHSPALARSYSDHPNSSRFVPRSLDGRPPDRIPTANAPPAPHPAAQLEAKVVILGMQGVGKTSIVHRYTTGSFSYSLTSTIGASFCTKKLSVDGCKVRLQIWDTAGQERFRSMAPMYYRGANAAILVYDITNKDSFHDIENWLAELRENMSGDLVIQVVGSKADLAPARRAVHIDEAQTRVAAWTAATGGAELLLAPRPGPVLDEGGEGYGSPVGITEVSAKDDSRYPPPPLFVLSPPRPVLTLCAPYTGIEELFLILSRRLVLRKALIEGLRSQASRDSVRIHAQNPSPHHSLADDHAQPAAGPRPPPSGFCC